MGKRGNTKAGSTLSSQTPAVTTKETTPRSQGAVGAKVEGTGTGGCVGAVVGAKEAVGRGEVEGGHEQRETSRANGAWNLHRVSLHSPSQTPPRLSKQSKRKLGILCDDKG